MANVFSGSYNGLGFGTGTPWAWSKMSGFQGMAPIRSADEPKAGDQGAFAGIDYMTVKTYAVGLLIRGANLADFDAQADQIEGAFSTQLGTELPLVYTLGDPTMTRQVNVRPTKCDVPRDLQKLGLSAYAAIELKATDPRKYAATQTVLTTGLATASGGMTFPATFPLSFGTVGAGGTVSATNAGNFQTPLSFTIAGPVANPIVDNLTTGQSLLFLITLASTDTLVVNLAGTSVCSIVLNGTASRRNALGVGSAPLSQFGLPGGVAGPSSAGTAQMFRYRNNGAFTASTLTIAYRSAWI